MNKQLYYKCLHNGISPKQVELYSFIISNDESDPDSKVTYSDDNKNYSPAYMDYEKDKFNYGSWADAFFMKFKPCMLKYDGTVDYYLDPNDYTKKEDGTPSDVANINYEGNAMIEFPKTYYKKTDMSNGAKYSFSNVKLDEEYKCWSHIDNNGNEIDYCYMPIYDGNHSSEGGIERLRSISNRSPRVELNAQREIDLAKANNLTDDIIWYTGVMCDIQLIRLLLILISKSTDSQTKFGTGNCNSGNSISGIKASGTLDNKGLFYGTQDQVSCVKVFGMENFWGNYWKRIAGWINDSGIQKIKMTYGTSDGSTVEGYNLDGNGYIAIPDSTPSGTDGGCISNVKFIEFGIIPYGSSGSTTTHFCDGLWFNNSQNNYAFVGGASHDNMLVGSFCSTLNNAWSRATWAIGASLSCKPLSTQN